MQLTKRNKALNQLSATQYRRTEQNNAIERLHPWWVSTNLDAAKMNHLRCDQNTVPGGCDMHMGMHMCRLTKEELRVKELIIFYYYYITF
jgi:hypothetical protein